MKINENFVYGVLAALIGFITIVIIMFTANR